MPNPQVTMQRFSGGRTPEQWLSYIGAPENLSRPTYTGTVRVDNSAIIRARYAEFHLSSYQVDALKQLAAMPNGSAKLLIIGECWSSDCRRDMPTLLRVGEAAGMDVRVFNRDSAQGKEPGPQDANDTAGNGDLMHQFLNVKDGKGHQSVPVGVFFTRDMQYLYHFTEFSVLYQKDAFLARMRTRLPGEADAAFQQRTSKAFIDLQGSPFFKVWADAAVDEMITCLWERVVMGEG